MSEEGIPEGGISRTDVAELAPLFDQFEHAFDPLSPEAKEAENEFEDRVRALYNERIAPAFPTVSFAEFRLKLRSLCRIDLRKNPP